MGRHHAIERLIGGEEGGRQRRRLARAARVGVEGHRHLVLLAGEAHVGADRKADVGGRAPRLGEGRATFPFKVAEQTLDTRPVDGVEPG